MSKLFFTALMPMVLFVQNSFSNEDECIVKALACYQKAFRMQKSIIDDLSMNNRRILAIFESIRKIQSFQSLWYKDSFDALLRLDDDKEQFAACCAEYEAQLAVYLEHWNEMFGQIEQAVAENHVAITEVNSGLERLIKEEHAAYDGMIESMSELCKSE